MENRVKPFENIRNFRDFGGYVGHDDKKVRTGVLFRSAQFGEASDADLAALAGYNIKVQADLRRPDERERHGHRWPERGVQIISSDKGRAKDAPHVQFLSEVAVDAQKARGWMIDYYREAPYRPQLIETYSAWFAALAQLDKNEAAVVNCAAGKDRTGILCALTHHLLGVCEADIFADYSLTNIAANVAERLPQSAAMFNAHIGKNYPDEVYQPFVGVQSDFLTAALDSIAARSGDVDTYLAQTLSVSDTLAQQLRDALLN